MDWPDLPGERLAALARFQEILEVRFRDVELLNLALMHGSFANEGRSRRGDSYERLEFLGDAVLSLSVSDQLYRRFPTRTEGDLARLRASLVNEGALAAIARDLGVGPYILVGRGEEKAGGRERPSLLADVLEAVAGAVYVDAGYGVAHAVVTRWFAPLIDELEEPAAGDFKSQLQEFLQQRRRMPRYRIAAEEGPDHAKAFVAVVEVDGKALGRGRGRSKKEAEQEAAREALEGLESRHGL